MFGDGKTPPDKGADEVFWRYRLADLVIDLAKSFCSETTELIYEFSDVKKDDYRDREFFNTHCQHPLDPWDGNDVLINGTITIRRAHCSFYHRIQTIEADYITVVINFESALDKNNIFDKNELIGMVLNTYDALSKRTTTPEYAILSAIYKYHRNDVDYGDLELRSPNERRDRINPWDYYLPDPPGFGMVSLKKGIPIKITYPN